jgi:glucosyl-3-phosphoglycerate synthase
VPARPPASQEWFAARTWDHTEFDAAGLVAAKGAAGATVSVVVPALDEAGTVGGVVASVRPLHDAGLVDELVVVDGGSADATARVAGAAGAVLVDQHRVLPAAGPGRGKGDALWKGLAATTGDLVVFVDADLHEPDRRYVVGLLGPLLTHPAVGFVKACYDRPLREDGRTRSSGGGRVTELTARPLLAAFWPDLAGVAQPLAGEYAGRRDVLEAVPFVQGYGVEFGLLVDVAAGFGVSAIGQVDLGRRLHRHQPLAALGRMSAEILHLAAARLQADGRLDGEPSPALPQPVRGADGRLALHVAGVRVDERPPLRSRGYGSG